MIEFLKFLASGKEKDSPSVDTQSEHERLLEENRRLKELLEERERIMRENERRLEEQERTLEEKERTFEEKERTFEEQERTAEEYERTLKEKKEVIEEHEKTVKKHKRRVERYKKLIEKLKEELRLLRNKGKTEKTPQNPPKKSTTSSPTDETLPAESSGRVPEHVQSKAAELKDLSDDKKKKARDKKSQERANRRKDLAKKLPIFEERTIPLPESCPCCRGELKDPFKMERTEKYCAVPSPIQIVVTYKPTAICPTCNTFVYAADKEDPFPRTQFDETFAAKVIVEKILDGMPLHRQKEALEREGVELSEDALEDLFLNGSDLLAPTGRFQTKRVADSKIVSGDATGIRIRIKDDDGKSSYHRGSFCVAMNGDREIAAEASPNQKASGFAPFFGALETFVCDGAAIFPALIEKVCKEQGKVIREANCNSHGRRKFHEALGADPELAQEALTFYQALYAVEAKADLGNMSADERQRLRNEEARPVTESFKRWCQEVVTLRKRGDRIYKAIQYVLNRWDKLTLYLEDGTIPIDTNAVERLMKLIARGRKNFLHASSVEGAKACALYYSLIFTCINLGINPKIYLADVLRRASITHHKEHNDLVPAVWKELYEKEALERYASAPVTAQEVKAA